MVEPRADSLLRVASALKVRMEDLLLPVRQLKAVRFRAQKRMTKREDLIATVARWLEYYAEVEALVGSAVRFRLEDLAKELRRRRRAADPIEAATKARAALGIGDSDAIRNIAGLLEDSGIKVFKPSVASEGFFGLSVGAEGGGPAIVVNCWDRISVERWIFTAAHELGHLLLHLDAYDVEKSEEEDAQEAEANLFASHFLMPEAAFTAAWQEARGLDLVDRVFKVKRIFHVSWKTVVYRAAERSTDGGKMWPQFYGAYKRSRGSSLRGVDEPHGLAPDAFRKAHGGAPVAKVADEPEHLLPSDFLEDRLLGLVRKGIEAEVLSLGRAAEVLDLDLPAMRQLAGSWVE